MKARVLGLAIGLFLSGQAGFAAATVAPFYTISSPDHPRSWFAGSDFDKLDQALRWDKRSQVLCLDITYTLHGEWPLHDDPELYNRFTVHFPAVHLDADGRRLYFDSAPGRRTFIGAIQPEFFGQRIVLDSNVEISAHRRNGVIDAALVVYPPPRT